ncbi:MAG: hypothetical protein QJR03_15915 [Sphaerobacter sp.]|nr:hypothetical protein [Sphaerobacter sp.]
MVAVTGHAAVAAARAGAVTMGWIVASIAGVMHHPQTLDARRGPPKAAFAGRWRHGREYAR